jgi:hypothetical protein
MKSSLPFTSVVSYHTNPTTCGVARFGSQLAERLGVPFVSTKGDDQFGSFPLLSLKWSEVLGQFAPLPVPRMFGVFWHDDGCRLVTSRATHVFYADPSLGSPGLFCPSLIAPKKRTSKLFTFGMAGRQQVDQFRKVKALLDNSQQPYHLRVSVGIHEGTSLDRVERHFDDLKTILGPEHVTILGILSDDAVSEELANADYVLAFFEKGARANNTTIHAAIEAGAGVITNWDSQTPLFFHHATKSIDHLAAWPKRPGCHVTPYTWDALLSEMSKLCERSPSAPAR